MNKEIIKNIEPKIYCNHCGAELTDEKTLFVKIRISENFYGGDKPVPSDTDENKYSVNVPMCKECAKEIYKRVVPDEVTPLASKLYENWDGAFEALFPNIKYIEENPDIKTDSEVKREVEIVKIRSGGQSGADRAALDAARLCNIPICGWCPKDGWAEDRIDPPGLLKDYPELREAPYENPRQRTVWNLNDADATLVIYPKGAKSEGTDHTINMAEELNKPLFIIEDYTDIPKAVSWLKGLNKTAIEINIGGPRESERPGIYEKTKNILISIMFELTKGDH